MPAPPASPPAAGRGRLTLVLLCAVQFPGAAGSPIMTVALPSIRRDLILAGACRLVPGGRPGGRPAGAGVPGAVLAAGGTLYRQDVPGFSPIRGGPAGRPVTAGIVVAAGVSARLSARAGTRPVIPAGPLNASRQPGTPFGPAIFPATARTGALPAARAPGMPRSPQGSAAPCWPARSSCSPPPSPECAPPTAAASPSRQAAPAPPPARFPHRNRPARPRPRQPRAARQRTASRSPHVRKS